MLEPKKYEFDLGNGRKVEVTLRVSDVEELDVDDMSIEELEAYIAQLRAKRDALEDEEPDDEDSDEYEEWEEECEQLEDMIDDAQDRLDDLLG